MTIDRGRVSFVIISINARIYEKSRGVHWESVL